MLGWKLFVRAVTLVSDNLPAALKLSALPYGIVVCIDLYIASRWSITTEDVLTPGADVPNAFVGASLLSMLVSLAASLWIAVGWHRFALRAEWPEGWVPRVHSSEIGTYLVRSIGIGLIVAAAILIVGIVTAPFAVVFGAGLVSAIIPSAGFFVGMILFYRLGLALPAAAVGEELSFGDAWKRTAGQTGTMISLALLTVGATLAFQVPLMLEGTGTVLSAVYKAVTGWITLMLGVGVLTALYGHLVEGRPVD